MRTSFTPDRLVKMELHGPGQQYQFDRTVPMTSALLEGMIQPADAVLYAEKREDGLDDLVFLTRPLALYNVMQGQINGLPWLGTF